MSEELKTGSTGAGFLRVQKMKMILEILALAKRIVKETGKPIPLKGVEKLW